MSHFTTIKTKCTDQDLLVKSIQQIGYVAKIGKFNCRGYQGNKTTVDILILGPEILLIAYALGCILIASYLKHDKTNDFVAFPYA